MVTVNFWAHRQSLRGRISFDRLLIWIKRAGIGLRRGWLAYRRYNRLCKLSDEALRKKGLRREQVGRHAFFRDDL